MSDDDALRRNVDHLVVGPPANLNPGICESSLICERGGDCEGYWECGYFFMGPVLWILLYGYVIFPHIATEKNRFLVCNTVLFADNCYGQENCELYHNERSASNCRRHQQWQRDNCEQSYNEQTETYEDIEECELTVNVWFYGVPAGIASAFFSYVLFGSCFCLWRERALNRA